jgi:hypothetical protein
LYVQENKRKLGQLRRKEGRWKRTMGMRRIRKKIGMEKIKKKNKTESKACKSFYIISTFHFSVKVISCLNLY